MSKEPEQRHQAWVDLVAPLMDEPLVALQSFFPGDRWSAPFRFRLRRLTGRGRLDDRLPQMSLLVVGEKRVSVRGVRYSYAVEEGMEILEPLGQWPRSAVTGTVSDVTLTNYESYYSWTWDDERTRANELKLRRVTLTTPDGTVMADLPHRNRETTRVCNALGLQPVRTLPWWRSLMPSRAEPTQTRSTKPSSAGRKTEA